MKRRRRRAERRHRPARPGLKVGWVSRVGNDSFGRFVLQSLAKEGIDSHAVAIDNRFATGFQMKSKVENGTDPIVEYFRRIRSQPSFAGRFSRRLLHQRPPSAPERRRGGPF